MNITENVKYLLLSSYSYDKCMYEYVRTQYNK